MGMFKSLVFKVRKDLESKRTIEEDIQQRSVLSVISQKGSTEGNSHLTEEPIIEEIDSPVVNDCDTSKVPRTLDREQGEQEQQLLSKEKKNARHRNYLQYRSSCGSRSFNESTTKRASSRTSPASKRRQKNAA